MNSLDRFSARLLGDEPAYEPDMAGFAANLAPTPDERQAANSALGIGTDFFSTGNSGVSGPLGSSDVGGPPRAAPVASDFRTDLIAASGGKPSGGPVPIKASIPQQQVDMSGMTAPALNLNGGVGGGRMSPGQIDRRGAGLRDENVDLTGMAPPVAAGGPMAPSGPQGMQLSMPQARFIGAHHDNSLIPWTKDTRNAMVRDELAMGKAQQDEQRALQTQNVIKADAMEQQYNDAENRRIDRLVKENERKQYVDTRAAKLDDLIANVANGKEDPNRIYNKADTGTKIALGIGAFFGGLIPGVAPLMKMLGGSINADVEAQRQDKHNQQVGINQAQKQLEDVRHDFGDQRSNELANEAQQWSHVQTQIEAQMARSNDPVMKARAEQMLVATGGRLTDLAKQLDQISYVKPQVIGGGGTGNPKAPDNLFVPTGANGVGYRARTEKEAQQGRSLRAAVSALENVVNQGVATRKKTNIAERAAGASGLYTTDDYANTESLGGQAVGAVKEAEQLGALDKGSSDLAQRIVGDFSAVRGNPEVKAAAYLNNARKRLADFERAQAGQGVHQEIHRDANGQLSVESQGEASYASSRPSMPTMRTVDGRVVGGSSNTPQETPGYVIQDRAAPTASKGGKPAHPPKGHKR